jgi:hypothetical protein
MRPVARQGRRGTDTATASLAPYDSPGQNAPMPHRNVVSRIEEELGPVYGADVRSVGTQRGP